MLRAAWIPAYAVRAVGYARGRYTGEERAPSEMKEANGE